MQISQRLKLLIVVFLSGFTVMELEILTTRILSPVFGGTIYVWTSLIGATLTYLAIGYWYAGKRVDRKQMSVETFGLILFIAGIYIALFPHIARLMLRQTFNFGIVYGPLVSSFLILALPIFFLGFIIPGSVKLATSSLDKVGTKSGEMYSVSTIGSIAGTLLTGFYLIQTVGVTNSCLITGAITVLISLLLVGLKTKKTIFLIAISLFALILIFFFPANKPTEIIETFDSYYGRVAIVERQLLDGRVMRELYLDSLAQTAVFVESKENAMGYIKYFKVPLEYLGDADDKSVLIIGLAGGYTAKQLVEQYNIDMDVVEIEPRMQELAKEYFFWEDEGKIFFDDGRHFLKNAEKYDIIFIDIGFVFSAWNLYTVEAFKEYHDHLNDNGIVVININAAKQGEHGRVTQSLVKSLKQYFKEVLILRNTRSDPEALQSMAIIAFKEEIDMEKFLQINIESFDSFKVVEDNKNLYIDGSVKLTTDDFPIAEFYDYENWGEWKLVTKTYLKYFLPY